MPPPSKPIAPAEPALELGTLTGAEPALESVICSSLKASVRSDARWRLASRLDQEAETRGLDGADHRAMVPWRRRHRQGARRAALALPSRERVGVRVAARRCHRRSPCPPPERGEGCDTARV